MADNQMVKIEFDFDLGNVPASAKKFADYLKGIETIPLFYKHFVNSK